MGLQASGGQWRARSHAPSDFGQSQDFTGQAGEYAQDIDIKNGKKQVF